MRNTRAIVLMTGLAMMVSACSLPQWGGGGADLASGDVITITRTSAGMFGLFGAGTTEIAEDTVTSRYSLPNNAEIYALTEELAAPDREHIEHAAEEYLEWERTLSERARTPCTDIPSDRIEISGSTTHESTVQDCSEDTPLRALKQSVTHAQSEFPEQLAHPTDEWTIEIRPWAGDGPDESADVERYALTRAEHEKGMGITAQNAPSGWGAELVPEGDDPASLGWDTTGTVLTEINGFLLGQRQLGCGDQTGEIRVIKQGEPSLTWTYRLCPGQQSEVLAQTLRGL